MTTVLKDYEPHDDDELVVGKGGFLINISDKKILPRPTQKRPGRRATRYPSQCPECEQWRLLRWEDANTATKCRRCHCRDAGRKGYARTLERWGKDFAIKHVQAFQTANPSKAEQLVARWLHDLGIPYETQVIWTYQDKGEEHTFLLDFVIPLKDSEDYPPLLIEVNGPFHDPQHPLANPKRIARDHLLQTIWPGEMITLWVKNLEADPQTVRNFFINKVDIILPKRKNGH